MLEKRREIMEESFIIRYSASNPIDKDTHITKNKHNGRHNHKKIKKKSSDKKLPVGCRVSNPHLLVPDVPGIPILPLHHPQPTFGNRISISAKSFLTMDLLQDFNIQHISLKSQKSVINKEITCSELCIWIYCKILIFNEGKSDHAIFEVGFGEQLCSA